MTAEQVRLDLDGQQAIIGLLAGWWRNGVASLRHSPRHPESLNIAGRLEIPGPPRNLNEPDD
jgi:hypothetical protein